MRLYVDSAAAGSSRARVVAVSINRADATVGDLAVALSLPESALIIDGVVHLGDVALGDVALVEGARVGPIGSGPSIRSGIGRSWVGVVGGPEAGVVRRMDSDGAVTIGRGPHNDLRLENSSVSDQHAVIERNAAGLTVTDFDSTNGTWIGERAADEQTRLAADGQVRVGSSTIECVEIDKADKPLATSASHADDNGRVLFTRSPRGPVPEAPESVAVPEALPNRASPTLAIVSILVPLVIAGVLVLTLGELRFALFALLSPLMVLGNWWGSRRKVSKERSGDVLTRRQSIQRLRNELGQADQDERSRRRDLAPDLLEVRRRIELPSSRLWERRLDSSDAMTLRLGVGIAAWAPAKAPERRDGDEDEDTEVDEILAEHSELENVEILVDLRRGPLGFVGSAVDARKAATAGLLQLATHHGPADISIAILASEENVKHWEWAQWLPHVSMPNGGVRIFDEASGSEFASNLFEQSSEIRQKRDEKKLVPSVLLVVDNLEILRKRGSKVRELLARTDQNVYGMVIAPVKDRLPASVVTVVDVDEIDGEFRRSEPARPEIVETGIIDGVSSDVALDLARSMARFDDPELVESGGAVPTQVLPTDIYPESIFDERTGAAEISERWTLSKESERLLAPIAVSDVGALAIDLVHDGPHGLVAGTTGAGKSEFLRTLVLGLASNHDPDDLVFVLIDYKGGSAFDRCAALPHVVGLVTDLDPHLAERALQSLEAELHHRETVLRSHEASDITEYRALGSTGGPLPRLVVVIDEFATMRTELPDFVTSLVGIAQRGRSLGVHLILATQRPSGAVDANIRANTNLRVALRVQDAADSTDVIDDQGAAHIDRSHRGRALFRRGEGDLLLAQTAYVSGPMRTGGPALAVVDVPLGPTPPIFPEAPEADGATYLELLVDVMNEAARKHAPARRPWLEELPAHIPNPVGLEHLEPGDDAHVLLAIGDDPKNQRRVTRGWNLDDGHLSVVGGPGSGVTTTLRSTITALGVDSEERSVWVYPIDHGAGGLAGIDRFDHVGDVIDGSDQARQARLLEFLSMTFDKRRAAAAGSSSDSMSDQPLIAVVIDGIGSFAELNEVQSGTTNGDLLNRIGRDGASVGIYLVIGASAQDQIPRFLRNSIHQTVVLEQADERAYFDFGIKTKNLPSFVPGRALLGSEAMVAQVIDWEAAAENGSIKIASNSAPPSIETLANNVSLSDLPPAELKADLIIPFGLNDKTREPASLRLRSGEHGLIAGPSNSGRTTTLRVLASQLRRGDPAAVLVGVANTDSPLFDDGAFDAGGPVSELEGVFESALEDDGRWIIVVDDADRIDLDDGALFDIARNAPANVTILASVRSSTARQAYGHWTRFVRSSGVGILLEPDPSVDGELLGVRLPKKRLEPLAGRGYSVASGELDVIQVAQ